MADAVYRVVKRISLDGRDREVGEIVTMDQKRGDWMVRQHKALVPVFGDSALVRPRPIVRCCGR